jgi:hypothetical protein
MEAGHKYDQKNEQNVEEMHPMDSSETDLNFLASDGRATSSYTRTYSVSRGRAWSRFVLGVGWAYGDAVGADTVGVDRGLGCVVRSVSALGHWSAVTVGCVRGSSVLIRHAELTR